MSARRKGRPGFTIVELLIVLLIVAILAGLAVPAYGKISLRARATAALADIEAIRTAAFAYNADTNRWPADVSRGIVPPELKPYLGEGFSFERGSYLLDWDNWGLGNADRSGRTVLLGVSLVTSEEALGDALVNLVGDKAAAFTIGEHYTFIIAAR